jgi:uncharacterized membrane protein YebE (DUF533 family)
MNPQALLDQFLGSQTTAAAGEKLRSASKGLSSPNTKVALGGVAAGGLLGLLLGNKKARKKAGKLAGGVVGYGGAAALGALAHRAYQNWQDQKSQPVQAAPAQSPHTPSPPAPPPAGTLPPVEPRFDPTANVGADGRPFALTLVRAMIAAANADGHICEDERKAILSHLSDLQLDADDKSFVFEALMTPSTLDQIADLANGPEQATEVYLVSRMAIDPDDPAEKTYLDSLARRLALPPELVAELESQVKAQISIAA